MSLANGSHPIHRVKLTKLTFLINEESNANGTVRYFETKMTV